MSTYAEVWLAEMWMPVHQYGQHGRIADDPRRHFAAERRRVNAALAKRSREAGT